MRPLEAVYAHLVIDQCLLNVRARGKLCPVAKCRRRRWMGGGGGGSKWEWERGAGMGGRERGGRNGKWAVREEREG